MHNKTLIIFGRPCFSSRHTPPRPRQFRHPPKSGTSELLLLAEKRQQWSKDNLQGWGIGPACRGGCRMWKKGISSKNGAHKWSHLLSSHDAARDCDALFTDKVKTGFAASTGVQDWLSLMSSARVDLSPIVMATRKPRPFLACNPGTLRGISKRKSKITCFQNRLSTPKPQVCQCNWVKTWVNKKSPHKENLILLLREWMSWNLRKSSSFCHAQVLLNKKFHSRPGCRRTSLVSNSKVGGGGQIRSSFLESKSAFFVGFLLGPCKYALGVFSFPPLNSLPPPRLLCNA